MAREKRAAGSIAGALQRVRVKSKEERAKSKRKGRGKRKACSAECRLRAGSVATGENSWEYLISE